MQARRENKKECVIEMEELIWTRLPASGSHDPIQNALKGEQLPANVGQREQLCEFSIYVTVGPRASHNPREELTNSRRKPQRRQLVVMQSEASTTDTKRRLLETVTRADVAPSVT